MKIKEIMTEGVEVISPDATIKDAAQKMDDINVGVLPVCDGEKLVGIITDRDIVIRSISAGQDPNSTPVTDVMTSDDLIYCLESDDLQKAAKLMEEHQIRRLPILSEQKQLIGIVSLGDLAVDSKDEHLTAEVIEKVSEPSEPAA